MRIGIDVDGVIADFDRSWVTKYNKDFNDNIQYKEILKWDALLDLTHFKTYEEWWGWAKPRKVFYDAPLIPGAADAMQKLHDRGHTLCIISAKPRWANGEFIEWLDVHKIPYDELHITDDKKYVYSDIAIDDAIHNVESYLSIGMKVIQFFAWPYVNDGYLVPGAMKACSWRDVLGYIEGIEKGLL